ncbi:MAG: site-2 protease family protein [Pseudomonadota bacterium]
MTDLIQTFAVYALPIVFAITLHEAAHAYAAKYFGDDTAYSLGRMSLNPIKHIDPIGTLLIPIVLFFAQSPFLFGYAKPVPVEFGRLRNPKRDMAWVALAGPGANFVMALMWLLFSLGLLVFGATEPYFLKMAKAGVETNLVILAFNLFPIPPLDGGRVMASMLPNRQAYQYAKLEPYGFFIVLALAYFQILHFWMVPVMGVAQGTLQLLLTPLSAFLS